jgi:hypothetical protein
MESGLARETALTLRSHSRRTGTRVVLIRRPRWAEPGPRCAFLVRSDRAHQWIERIEFDDERSLMGLDLRLLDVDDPPGIGEPGPDCLTLVCTNGRHDPCCADFGRPVMRALATSGLTDVWESSHVGGDRFAANVVCLPTGTYHGRVEPAGAEQLLRDVADRLVDLDHYRGRCCYPPLVQAAEIFARRELEERRVDALRVVSVTKDGDDAVSAELAHDGPGGQAALWVQVAREPGRPEHLTCADHGMSRPWRYRLLALARVPAG